MEGYSISDKFEDMDLDVIYSYISQSYWAAGIPRTTLEKAVSNSFCFGVFAPSGEQIGFARLITDRATFAYLADVFILEQHRGHGLSKWLVETIIQHPDLQGLRRVMLATKDAHNLYARYGFKPIENPEMLMQIWQPGIYQNNN
ncbi:GNAT family N-acetyltransferase [Vibrio hannami]|uniref:GNAT family N-acetyltransferase n=1 Tax=Vibrio hannami TaxID=2717094 RepID=UPI00240FCD9A|nr:GNAT family N-acetyltransferase [Vibrio hannami]MDG3085096.1 GNAT family N-acetyltransferase [Vibrio hannami]